MATSRLRVFVDGELFTGSDADFERHVTEACVVGSTVRAFRGRTDMRRFARKSGWGDAYDLGVAERRKARARRIHPTEERRMRALQDNAVRAQTARFRLALKLYRTRTDNRRTLTNLVARHDPFTGPIIHSTVLYTWKNFIGVPLVLASALWYRRLGWWGYDDRADSAQDFHHGTQLYQFNDFRGIAYFIPPLAWVADFGWFSNRASSAICNP